MKSILIIIFATLSALCAQAFPDGAWNGKPWDAGHLKRRAEGFHADGMAEWAYCSVFSVGGLKFDKQQIFRRAKTSAEKGSALGRYLLALCANKGWGSEINEEKALKILREELAKPEPHPETLAYYGSLELTGYGPDKDEEGAVIKVSKARDMDSLNARLILAEWLRTGKAGELDLETSMAEMKELMNKHEHRLAAEHIFRFTHLKARSFKKLRENFTEEEKSQSLAIVKRGAESGVGYDDFLIRYWEIEKGKLHQSMPQLILNGKRTGGYSHRAIVHMTKNFQQDSHSGIRALTIGEDSRETAAKEAYRLGMRRDRDVLLTHARKLLVRQEKQDPKQIIQGREMLRELFYREGPSECSGSHELADHLGKHYFTQRRAKKPIDDEMRKDFERCIHHLILHSSCQTAGVDLLNFLDRKDELCDPVKALAAAYWLEKIAYDQGIKKWSRSRKDTLLKELTPEQRKQAEALRDDGYPNGKKWRQEAFEALKKLGDIAPNYVFDPGERFPGEKGDL